MKNNWTPRDNGPDEEKSDGALAIPQSEPLPINDPNCELPPVTNPSYFEEARRLHACVKPLLDGTLKPVIPLEVLARLKEEQNDGETSPNSFS